MAGFSFDSVFSYCFSVIVLAGVYSDSLELASGPDKKKACDVKRFLIEMRLRVRCSHDHSQVGEEARSRGRLSQS